MMGRAGSSEAKWPGTSGFCSLPAFELFLSFLLVRGGISPPAVSIPAAASTPCLEIAQPSLVELCLKLCDQAPGPSLGISCQWGI